MSVVRPLTGVPMRPLATPTDVTASLCFKPITDNLSHYIWLAFKTKLPSFDIQ